VPGIYIAAAGVAALLLAGFAVLLFTLAERRDRWLLAGLLLVQLPMSAAAFFGLRMPLDGVIRGIIADQGIYTIATLFYAPLTEEPAKLWPLLLPFVRRHLEPRNAFGVALALGLGFGIGEIGFLAERVSRAPGIGALPWHAFGGFAIERWIVCVWHIGFVAVTVFAVARRSRAVPLAFAGSMLLHFIGNFPIYLAARDVFGLGGPMWQQLLFVWLLLFALLMAGLVAYLALRRGREPVVDAPRRES